MKFKKLKNNELTNLIEELTTKLLARCPKCGSAMKITSKNRSICTESLCKSTSNIWQGTFWQKMKLEKTAILEILELWMQKMSISNIEYVTGISRSIYLETFN